MFYNPNMPIISLSNQGLRILGREVPQQPCIADITNCFSATMHRHVRGNPNSFIVFDELGLSVLYSEATGLAYCIMVDLAARDWRNRIDKDPSCEFRGSIRIGDLVLCPPVSSGIVSNVDELAYMGNGIALFFTVRADGTAAGLTIEFRWNEPA